VLTVKPYPYQDSAIDQILDNGFGLIAYEMGLGKTLVAIAAAEELLGDDEIDMALIVVPASLKYQWAESIAKFTDVETKQKKVKREHITIPTERYCVVVDGPPAKRKEQYKFIRENRPDYVIIAYSNVVNDFRSVKRLEADCLILDECTAIKGFKAQRSKKVKALAGNWRIGLTGTPIENRPEEVYSIMEFVEPDVLGRWDLFDKTYIDRNGYGQVRKYKNLDLLHKRLKKVMARKTRLDPEVAPYMPKVDHSEVYVGLPPKAWKLYNVIARALVSDLEESQFTGGFDLHAYYSGESDGDMSAQGKIMAKMMALQMLCNHPDLLRESAEKYDRYEGGSQYAWDLHQAGLLDNLGAPEKFNRVVEEIRTILEFDPQNKVIVFSFFKGMLRLLQDALSDYDSVAYTGDLTATGKAAAKARFQNNEDCRLFLSSDAGGYGVDLPQANYLINYDLAHSAGTMDQRNARHVRAGSGFDLVYVMNFLVEGSIEERTFERLVFKRKVAKAVIDGKGAGVDGEIEYTVSSLKSYLVDEDDEEAA
jgi:SNF2 family DNA or RNA helicase